LLHAEFSAVDYTLNIVSECRFSLYLNMRALRTGLENFSWCPGLSWIFCQ